MGLLRYLRGDDLLEDRSAQPNGEARSLPPAENELPLFGGVHGPTVRRQRRSRSPMCGRRCGCLPTPPRSLPLHVYRKTDTGRERVTSGKLVELLDRPAGCRASAFVREPVPGWGSPGGRREPDDPRPDRPGDGGVHPVRPAPQGGAGESRPVDPETAAHEARHAAIALMHRRPGDRGEGRLPVSRHSRPRPVRRRYRPAQEGADDRWRGRWASPAGRPIGRRGPAPPAATNTASRSWSTSSTSTGAGGTHCVPRRRTL